jgi:hypothetical protein
MDSGIKEGTCFFMKTPSEKHVDRGFPAEEDLVSFRIWMKSRGWNEEEITGWVE